MNSQPNKFIYNHSIYMAGGKGLPPYDPGNAVDRQPFADDLAPKKIATATRCLKSKSQEQEQKTEKQEPEISSQKSEITRENPT